jgi:hypothetical protein
MERIIVLGLAESTRDPLLMALAGCEIKMVSRLGEELAEAEAQLVWSICS